MNLTADIERAKQRAEIRRQVASQLRLLSGEEQRGILLDLLVENEIQCAAANAASTAQRLEQVLAEGPAPRYRENGINGPGLSKADRTLSVLQRHIPDGASVDEVAKEIYGSVGADDMKKAASMLSLLKSQQRAVRLGDHWFPTTPLQQATTDDDL